MLNKIILTIVLVYILKFYKFWWLSVEIFYKKKIWLKSMNYMEKLVWYQIKMCYFFFYNLFFNNNVNIKIIINTLFGKGYPLLSYKIITLIIIIWWFDLIYNNV